MYVFTTVQLSGDQVVALYGQRWKIETDRRSLKQTARLQRVAVRSSDMLAKELLAAVLAYNLVRALMVEAAQRTHADPRQLSFTRAYNSGRDRHRTDAACTVERGARTDHG